MILHKLLIISGIFTVLFIAYLISNNKKLIDYRLIIKGLTLQFILGYFILKTTPGKLIFEFIAKGINTLLNVSRDGGNFVFGVLMNSEALSNTISENGSFIFAIQIIPTVIFICALVSCLYYLNILQKITYVFAVIFNKLLGVSGAEALANSAVAFVGQVESAIVIQPYLSKMTKSELHTIMTGGMACISGSLMAIYSTLGINIEYLLAASCMAIPGSFVISKIIYPEDDHPVTKDKIDVSYKPKESNIIEAILDGAYSGAKICVGIIAMLIAIISLVSLFDKLLFLINDKLSLKLILGYIFSPLIFLIGVPKEDILSVSMLFGTKLSLNEFIAYLDLSNMVNNGKLNKSSIAIASFILCGFANFGSIAIQVGGLSQMAPERKSDLSVLGLKSMISGALVSLISGCIVGIIY